MIKTVVANLIPRVKKIYFKIFAVAAPLMLVQIDYLKSNFHESYDDRYLLKTV